jgi:predicted amidohydrolase
MLTLECDTHDVSHGTARAIESQCYVLAAAQVGKHNEKRESYGHSVGEKWCYVILNPFCLKRIESSSHNIIHRIF